MPWLQLFYTFLIPWGILTAAGLLWPQRLHTGYDGSYYYTPLWVVFVLGVNAMVVVGAILYAVLQSIWGF